MERLGKGARIDIPPSHMVDLITLLQNGRARESSVAISPDWAMLEEIEFHRLAKLRMEVDEPEDL